MTQFRPGATTQRVINGVLLLAFVAGCGGDKGTAPRKSFDQPPRYTLASFSL